MKTLFFVCSMALILQSCQDSKESADIRKFDRNIGQQIPLETAKRWTGRTNISARGNSLFEISSEVLRQSLDAVDKKIGVVLQHAQDDAGAHHILIAPLQESSSVESLTTFIDANTNGFVSTTTARSWLGAYADANPNKPLYHFFGSVVFDEIVSNASFNYMEIVPAMNDNEEPQLLLFVWNNLATSSGRTQSDQLVVYDFSNPCPPCAAEN
jgi:hypothetical protein